MAGKVKFLLAHVEAFCRTGSRIISKRKQLIWLYLAPVWDGGNCGAFLGMAFIQARPA